MLNKLKNFLSNFDRKRILFILLVVWAIGFFLMLFPIRTGVHYWDESVYIQNADVLLGGKDNYNELDFRPPFISFLIMFAKIFPNFLVVSHILVSLLVSLGIIGCFFLGREMYNEKVGPIASVFYLVLPLNLFYSHFLLVDFMLPTFLVFSFYFFIKAFKNNKLIDYVLGGLILAFSILVKFSAIYFIAIVGLAFIIYFKKDIISNLKNRIFKIVLSVSAFLVVIFPYLLFSKIRYGSFFHTIMYGRTIVGWGGYTPVIDFLKQLPEVVPYHLLFLMVFGIFYLFAYKKFGRKEIILFFAIIVPFLLNMTIEHKEPRYFTLIVPFVVVFCAKILYESLRANVKIIKYLILFVTLILFVGLIYFILINFQFQSVKNFRLIMHEENPPIMDAGLWLKDNAKYDKLYANIDWPILAYYSKLNLQLLPLFRSYQEEIDSVMVEPGYFVYGAESVNHEPSLDFVIKDKRFELVKEFGSENNKVKIFKYNPSFREQ